MSNAIAIKKSSDVKNILNQHHIFPSAVIKAQKTLEYSIQFHNRGLESGTDPVATWVEKVKDIFPNIKILDTSEHRAPWKVGNPVLIATIFADFPELPELDAITAYILMIQLGHIVKKRLILLALRFWAFLKWWGRMLKHLIYTPKLSAPQTAITVIKKMPIVESIRQHGKEATVERLNRVHAIHGIVAEQKYRDENPSFIFPSWDDLPGGQVITVNL